MKQTAVKYILSAAAMALITLFLLRANSAIAYAKAAMEICVSTIVPTLFPFFVCSGILLYSGFCESLAKLFRPCMRPLFRVSPAGAAAFVLGMISGYPLGAVTAGQLYESGYVTKTEAERLSAFCSNSGPLFILGSVGAAVYANIRIGVLLYVCHILASLTVGILFRFYKRGDYCAPDTVMTTPKRTVTEIISIAMDSAVKTMLAVCGAVIFFGMSGRLVIDLIPADGEIYALLTGMSEFVTGTLLISGLDIELTQKLIYTAFVVGFAGLSVHMQVIAAAGRFGLDMRPYLVGKLIHGVLALLYTMAALRLFPNAVEVFAPSMSRGVCAASAQLIIVSGVILGMAVIIGGRKGER